MEEGMRVPHRVNRIRSVEDPGARLDEVAEGKTEMTELFFKACRLLDHLYVSLGSVATAH